MPLRRESHSRYKIKALSHQLRKLSFPTSPISVDLATFAADAFDKFLTGKCITLDEAFRVEKGPGAPRRLSTAKEHLVLNKKISALRVKGKTWYQIEDELGIDARALRRIYKPAKIHLASRRIVASLIRSLKTARK